ncbi:DAO-domain-containing protein [Coprinopsis marcescibilis]|uniref:Glycerol-3-phosphate dehydrogenase n=1 Tax=Coprinopsis marcescibilis TaxID=230819 RepID=A0A5C3L2E4_COPMA|nr:DAO-domain-containing protein [Coprinopsis marcescibilis]
MPLVRRIFSRRSLFYLLGGTAIATSGGFYYLTSGPAYPASTKESRRPPAPWTPPSREHMITQLRASGLPKPTPSITQNADEEDEEEFDLLIVGGGATGAGVALDAASRGLRVALIERDDFSSGTSSKSTKLVHGGVRYLQKAIMEFDSAQYALVREALHERRIFLSTAPYLSSMLPIMLPIYKYWQVPYYWAGCKMYDVLAGKENMETSYVVGPGKALEAFPVLKREGLVGGVVYYDGQHNDSRMNIALVMTAVKHGAIAANYVELQSLLKTLAPPGEDGAAKITGAVVYDHLSDRKFVVRFKGLVNATGPFSDTLLALDDVPLPSPSSSSSDSTSTATASDNKYAYKPTVHPSSGVHITLPNYYSPRKMGLLDPATSDGRVIFFLPWQGNTIAGTTDRAEAAWRNPSASEEDVVWLLDEIRRYLSPDIRVRRGDVLSAWSGLRPLIRATGGDEGETAGLIRSHLVRLNPSGLLTIAGGKWTTYRRMAEETVDAAITAFDLERKRGCVSEGVRLVGSEGWSRTMFVGLIQMYGLETEVARHLSDNYGDRAWSVCELAVPTGERWPVHGKRIAAQYPYIEAEVRYAVRNEYAQTAIDVLARRTRLSFLNARAAYDAIPRVVEIMGEECGWGAERRRREVEGAVKFLRGSMGLVATSKVYGRSKFESGELAVLRGVFLAETEGAGAGVNEKADADARVNENANANEKAQRVGVNAKGEKVVKRERVLEVLRAHGVKGYEGVTDKVVWYVLDEAGVGEEGLGLDVFIEVCGSLKDVAVRPGESESEKGRERVRIPVEKSGGGV